MKTCECGSFWGPTWDHARDCRRWPGSESQRDRHGSPGVGGDVKLIIVEDSVEIRLWMMGFARFTPEQVADYAAEVDGTEWPDRD